jgi:predicted dehydrogenase
MTPALASPDATGIAPEPLAPVRAAVVGLGREGLAHAAVLANVPNCTLAGVADARGSARNTAKGVGFDAPAFSHVERLIERVQPEVVVVCVPQHERARVAGRAIEAGCAVLVERPVSHRLEDAEALWQLAAAKGRPFACVQPLPFQPVFTRAMNVLASGAIGRLRSAHASLYRSLVFGPVPRGRLDPEQVAGGVLAHLSGDLLALLVWMLGTPVSVHATRSLHHGPLEDELHAMMTLESGLEVGFDSSWSVPGYPRTSTVIELAGENGTLLVSNEACELELRAAAAGYPAGASGARDPELPQLARFDVAGEALYLQDAAFLCWATGGSMSPAAATGLASHRVMDALYRSAREDGRETAVTR